MVFAGSASENWPIKAKFLEYARPVGDLLQEGGK